MKKLLSLLTLLIVAIGTSWAADYTAPATKTYGSITFLDVAGTDANRTDKNGKEYLTYGVYYVAKTKNITTWFNSSDGSPASNHETTGYSITDAVDYGFYPVSSTAGDVNYGGTKCHSNRWRYFYVTGASSVAGIARDGDSKSNKYTQLKIEEVAEDGTLGTATVVGDYGSTSAGYLIDGGTLDPSKYYKISFGSQTTSNCYFYQVRFGKTPAKTIATQEYAGVKQGSTTLTENTDYTVSESTITLSDDFASTTAPSDIKLINRITYTDESTNDTDVDVEFGETASEGYFVGTATIDETEYTVKVPQDVTPTLTTDKNAVTVASVKVGTGTATIHLSGANLAGESVSVAFASAVTGLTVDKASVAIASGAVDADVTVSYQSNEDVAEASVNLVISTTGVNDITIPVTYSSTAGISTLEDVTAYTEWDWSTAATAAMSSPDQNSFVVFANGDSWNASFNAAAIGGKVKEMYASKSAYKYCQGGTLKFHTTVPGVVTIDFSNTGKKDEYRWLAVNGVVTEYKSKNEDNVSTEAVAVPAGDVLIEAVMGTTSTTAPEYTAANTMFNYRKVVFTPTTTINLNANGFATYSKGTDFTFSGATAYKMALDEEAKTITGTEVTGKIAAGEGILFKGEANATVTITDATGASALADNDLVGTTTASNELNSTAYAYKYSLSGDTFKHFTGTLKANKAFIGTDTNLANSLTLKFEGEEATAVEAIAEAAEAVAPVKVIKNGKLYIGNYNVAGQQVK